jgi:hypothetical protein
MGRGFWAESKKMAIDSFLSHSCTFSYTKLRSNRSQVDKYIYAMNEGWRSEELIIYYVKIVRFTVGIIKKNLIIPTENWRPTSFGPIDLDITTGTEDLCSSYIREDPTPFFSPYWYNFTRSNPAYFDRKHKSGLYFLHSFNQLNQIILITVLLFRFLRYDWTLISCMKKKYKFGKSSGKPGTSRWPFFSFGPKSSSHLWDLN